MLSWDNTARRGVKASVFSGFSLTRYSQWLAANAEQAAKDASRTDGERIVFVNAWNEWAEGTHLEPDSVHGYGYLEATRRVMENYTQSAAPFLRPTIAQQTDANYAIISHVHYPDTWPELLELISGFSDVDFYVTVTSLKVAEMVSSTLPSAVVEMVDNRGRDVRPFLTTMQGISHLGYRAVCKVHGKKSVYRDDGQRLRHQLLNTLLDPKIMDMFEADKRLGLVATEASMIPHDQRNMQNNKALVDEILEGTGVSFKMGRFSAGTMFWADPKAIEPLTSQDTNNFDIERGLADGTRAHAMERLFGIVAESQGYSIKTIK